MTEAKQIDFDAWLEIMFSTPHWIEGALSMLGVFCEDVQLCQAKPSDLEDSAPSIIQQTSALLEKGKGLSEALRGQVDSKPELFRAPEVTAATWWAGMAAYKGDGNLEAVRKAMVEKRWEDVLFDLHALLYDTVSCLCLTDVAQRMLASTEADTFRLAKPN